MGDWAWASAKIVGYRFGVDEDALNFRADELETVFELGDDDVHVVQIHAIGQGAVAGNSGVLGAVTDDDVVHVDDFMQLGGGAEQAQFDAVVGFNAGHFDGGWLTLDVGEDGVDLRDGAEDLGFERGDEIVGGRAG